MRQPVDMQHRSSSGRAGGWWKTRARRRRSILLTLGGFLLLAGSALAAGPVPVSPGTVTGGLTRDTCPTFLWSSGEGSAGYELVVYPVEEQGELAALPALSQRLPAGAQGWTPSAEHCLRPGARYAWAVRDIGSDSSGAWSEPAIFEVTVPSRAEVSEAMETLRRYLAGGGGSEDEGDEEDLAEIAGGLVSAGALDAPSPPPDLPLPTAPGIALESLDAMTALGEESLTPVAEESHMSGKVAIHAVEPSSSGASYGVWGESNSASGRGVFGLATATTGFATGVAGVSDSPAGYGVNGFARATSGFGGGVLGQSASTQGRGVFGLAFATSGSTIGVLGQSASTQGQGVSGEAYATSGQTDGVRGTSRSSQGRGVFGWASRISGFTSGVFGRSDSTQGEGVFGWALALTGVTHGVAGESSSPDGRGVLGMNSAATGTEAFGVLGVSRSTGGEGVFGQAVATSGVSVGTRGDNYSPDGRGVFGWARANSGENYGVFGQTNSASGYAGYFAGRSKVAGDLIVEGNLTKGSGTFKIDHPLDPANQYLSHSFVESPDMMNVYNGNAVLDEEGAAWVELPEYFGALNRDFRYQLTALDHAAPGLHVAERIAANRFRIAGGEVGMEVSWQVTGIRQDAYAEKNPIVVEEDKGELRGRYLHPEAHGQPAELAIGYVAPLEGELAEVPSAPSRAGEQEELASESRVKPGTAAPEATPSRPSIETDPTEGDRP